MASFIKQNQGFKTSDVVLLGFLLVLIAIISWTIVSEAFQDDRPGRAQASVESLALQLMERRGTLFESPVLPTDRGPASLQPLNEAEGELGTDPWGRPFRYRVLRAASGEVDRLRVWSLGANGVQETPDQELSSLRDRVPNFQGDDIGYSFEGKAIR